MHKPLQRGEIMMVPLYEDLLADLQDACETEGIRFEETKKTLEGLFGDDKIVFYYLARGPNPHAKEMVLDIFALSSECFYDYEIQQKYTACHVVFLDTITQLAESRVEEEEGYFAVHIRTAGLMGGLTLHEKLTARDNVRAFCLKVKEAIINSRRKETKETGMIKSGGVT